MALARTIGDKATIALALQSLVKALGFQGEATQAMALLEEALALANEFDGSDAIFPIAFYLGLMARKRGDPETARHFLTECLVLAQATDHQLHFGYALSELGITLCDFADYSTAKSHICQGLQVSIAINHYWGIAMCLEYLALLAAAMQKHERAHQLAGAAAHHSRLAQRGRLTYSRMHYRQMRVRHRNHPDR